MKALISNRIYLNVDRELSEKIKEELTYTIHSEHSLKPIVLRNYSLVKPGIMSIPVGRMDMIPSTYEIVDKRICAPTDFPEFKYKLRASQQAVYDDLNDNCLINAKVSWGKTFTGMAIAGKLGQKTLIVVHTIPLMNQWAKEVKKVYGFEPGLIGNGHDNSSMPITVGNVRSLYNRMDRLKKEFGTLIMDEVHHAPSPTFSKIVDASYSRYKIGLSGTLERKDGKHVVLRDYFGNKIYQPPKENCMEPKVHVLNTGLEFPDDSSIGWAKKVTFLKESPKYRALIVAAAKKYAAMGHKVLVVSDRTEFLKHVAQEASGALIIGEVQDRDAEFAKLDNGETRILCGTQSIMSEGISHDPLSCIILATPTNNMPLLEQLIGRIIRLHPDKLQPIVVDPKLEGWSVYNQFKNRLGHYIKNGYTIEYI